MKNALAIICILFTNFIFAQKIEIQGKVIDPDKKPVEAATVYLSSQKDSTLIDYTITDLTGNFKIPIKKVNESSFLTVSYFGFDDHSTKIELLKESLNLGTIQLQAASDLLDELVITTDAAPVRVKDRKSVV